MGVGFAFGFSLGWGTREALIIAGMTATSSSAIVTKLLIELRRLANDETPMILGVTVIEDVFIAIYLAIVSVVLSGDTNVWAVVGKLALAFGFLIVMFTPRAVRAASGSRRSSPPVTTSCSRCCSSDSRSCSAASATCSA